MASFDREMALDIIRNGTEQEVEGLLAGIESALQAKQFGLQFEHGGDGESDAFPVEDVVAEMARSEVTVTHRPGLSLRHSTGDGNGSGGDEEGDSPAETIPRLESVADAEGNVLLEGDNYVWLSVLAQTHAGMVDLIFIDPPYNTGKRDFAYNDKFVDARDAFSHSKWLSFMDRRLRLAKGLLKDDGLLFITIDDHELFYLKVLCDEIFGEAQFAACVPRKNVGSVTTKSDRELMKLHDYILVYRSSPKARFQKVAVGERRYPHEDEHGRYYTVPLQDNGPHGTRTARPNLWYPIYRNEDGSLTLEDNGTEPYWPRKHKGDDGRWMWSKAKFEADGHLLGISDRGTVVIKHYYNPDEDQTKWQRQRAWLDDAPNRLGTNELKDLFGTRPPFAYPKPTALVRWCIGLHPNKDALVLDFFAGSGTTAHAVEDANAADGGRRRWILATNNEGAADGDEQSGIMRAVTKPRIDAVITGLRPDGTRRSDGYDSGYDFFTYELTERDATDGEDGQEPR